MLSNEDEEVMKRGKYLVQILPQMGDKQRRMLPEELPYVLSYWRKNKQEIG